MFSWAWPWVFVLLPLPWFIMRYLKSAPVSSATALRVPYQGIDQIQIPLLSPLPQWQKRWSMFFLWTLLIIAAARPQWMGEPIDTPRSGRDLLLAVDASGSMSTPDMVLGGETLTRFAAVKLIAGDFIERRAGDRVGLILFGSQAYLLTPLTFDRKTVQTQLRESVVGLAGRETAIGDAIGLAVKRLQTRQAEQRILILLTDGVNTAGELDPRKATELAVSEKVRIYTVGMGAESMRVENFFGSQIVNPSADLDVAMLTDMAEKTGGHFFRAKSAEELAKIYQEIDRLEPAADQKELFRPIDELFFLPLSLAVLLATAGLLLQHWRKWFERSVYDAAIR